MKVTNTPLATQSGVGMVWWSDKVFTSLPETVNVNGPESANSDDAKIQRSSLQQSPWRRLCHLCRQPRGIPFRAMDYAVLRDTMISNQSRARQANLIQ